MKVLIFEWLIGGGLLFEDGILDVGSSLYRQGAAMWRAIFDDFRSAGHSVTGTYDFRLKHFELIDGMIPVSRGSNLPEQLLSLANSADAIFLVAPETGTRLLECLDWLEPYSDRLISPGRSLVELASSKDATCRWLRSAGVQSPCGLTWESGDVWPPQVPVPAVIKPDDGAGGEGLQIIKSWEGAGPPGSGKWRCEGFVAGESVSIAAICRPCGFLLLEPVQQQFEPGHLGNYVGGRFPVSPGIRELTRKIASRAIESLPGPIGFVGFDMIVDEAAGQATLLEINPRLTTSYVGLRNRCKENLAALLVADQLAEVQWSNQVLEFRV